MPFQKVNPDRYVKDMFLRSEQYAQGVRLIYVDYIDRLLNLVNSYPGVKSGKTFSFSNYPKLESQANILLRELYAKVYSATKNGIEAEWGMANEANDNLVKAMFGPKSIGDNHYARYFERNRQAMDAFINRKDVNSGLKLSDRVWKYSGQLKNEMDLALGVSIGAGKSAAEISREVRGYLNEPDKLFRRVRDVKGDLHLSKAAKAYNPTPGIYRSSYKNAMRVTRTETNMAYRAADHERYQQFDFVVGFEVKLSKSHPLRMPQGDICDHLAGMYPKEFKFVGWHPQCLCYVTSILPTDEEFSKFQDSILAGEDTSNFRSVNSVDGVPNGFHSWTKANTERGSGWASQPYFIRDNFVDGRIEKGLKENLANKNGNAADIKTEPFQLSDDSRKILIDNGFVIHGASDPYNTIMPGFNLVEFEDELSKFAIENNFNLTTKTLKIGKSYINILYKSKDYNVEYSGYGEDEIRTVTGFKLDRTFKINSNGLLQVDHNYLDIDSNKQGKGTTKIVFKSLYKQYQNSDIKIIDVFANIDVGGYAWGRYGFTISKSAVRGFPKSNIRFNARKLSSDELADAGQVIENYFNAFPDSERFPMNILAEKPYGKRLLLRSDWGGMIDLTKDEQKQVFEAYLFSIKPKK
jgi:hypothetical protein